MYLDLSLNMLDTSSFHILKKNVIVKVKELWDIHI